jgi:Cytochrome P460
MDPNDKRRHIGKDQENDTWVESAISSLAAPEGWEPNVEHALNVLRVRPDQAPASQARQAWMWAAAAAVIACLTLLGVPWLRTASGRGASSPGTAAVFDTSGRLEFPAAYRDWVYVGTSVGLGYGENGRSESSGERFQNVFIDPAAYAVYMDTGEFPDGTMMVLEIASGETKNEPGLHGTYEKEILGIEASVKDPGRFKGGWAYFRFTDRSGTTLQVAEAFPDEECWTCHDDRAETDHVFTQFYPVL